MVPVALSRRDAVPACDGEGTAVGSATDEALRAALGLLLVANGMVRKKLVGCARCKCRVACLLLTQAACATCTHPNRLQRNATSVVPSAGSEAVAAAEEPLIGLALEVAMLDRQMGHASLRNSPRTQSAASDQ